MALQEEEQSHHHLQPPPLFLLNDLLFCNEEKEQVGELDADEIALEEEEEEEESGKDQNDPFFPWDVESEDDLLDSLMSKQAETHLRYDDLISDGPLMAARKQAVVWILKVHSHYGFSALTAVVAVNYFDRFLLSFRFQRDKPWLGQLVAVACLSLAAKMEETFVPVQLLLHLQVEESVYLFEPKTIHRMELLVLSTLNWQMNPVTPLSFVDHIIRKMPFPLDVSSSWEFFQKCEKLILSVLTDVRLLRYLPSNLAAAVMLYIVKEVEPFDSEAFQDLVTCFIKINKDEVDRCYELLAESSGSHFCSVRNGRKRRKLSLPSSPSGVIDASFSCDSSNDSWAVASSVSSSPETNFKRSRVQNHNQESSGLALHSLSSFLRGCSQ